MNEALDKMFDELMDHYQAAQQRRNNNSNNRLYVHQQFEAVAEKVIDAVIAEMIQNADSSLRLKRNLITF
jgi:hypothetical protein